MVGNKPTRETPDGSRRGDALCASSGSPVRDPSGDPCSFLGTWGADPRQGGCVDCPVGLPGHICTLPTPEINIRVSTTKLSYNRADSD
jgi:hypothetical protein